MHICQLIMFIYAATFVSGCSPSSPSEVPASRPSTDTELPSDLNLRENLLNMRGISPDFNQEMWQQSSLQNVRTWQPQTGYYLLGSLDNGHTAIVSLLILEDGPTESNAWIVNYSGNALSDYILVFHQNDLQNRTVGSDWNNGRLDIRMRKGAERFREIFTVNEQGQFQPLTPVE